MLSLCLGELLSCCSWRLRGAADWRSLARWAALLWARAAAEGNTSPHRRPAAADTHDPHSTQTQSRMAMQLGDGHAQLQIQETRSRVDTGRHKYIYGACSSPAATLAPSTAALGPCAFDAARPSAAASHSPHTAAVSARRPGQIAIISMSVCLRCAVIHCSIVEGSVMVWQSSDGVLTGRVRGGVVAEDLALGRAACLRVVAAMESTTVSLVKGCV